MHRRRGVTLMVEEVGRRIPDRGWILIEDRPSGAGARCVDDAVRRRMLHHVVERGAPVVQPQIEATYSREYRVVGPNVAAHCATSGLTIASASSSGVTARRMGILLLAADGRDGEAHGEQLTPFQRT
jgi:hypothetical protein